MNIVELHSKPNMKFVTVTLSYNECKDVANSLCHIDLVKFPEFKGIKIKFNKLFELVKSGLVTSTNDAEITGETEAPTLDDLHTIFKEHCKRTCPNDLLTECIDNCIYYEDFCEGQDCCWIHKLFVEGDD